MDVFVLQPGRDDSNAPSGRPQIPTVFVLSWQPVLYTLHEGIIPLRVGTPEFTHQQGFVGVRVNLPRQPPRLVGKAQAGRPRRILGSRGAGQFIPQPRPLRFSL